MTFFEALRAHRGGLLRLKGELFWYGGRGWDGARGRICLLLDVDPAPSSSTTPRTRTATSTAMSSSAAVLLLIDGAPHWVWVGQEDVELIT